MRNFTGKLTIIAVLASLFASLLGFVVQQSTALALSGNEFRAGNIIDDAIFSNNAAMNPTQIQNFLNAKVPTCDTNGTQMYNGSQTRAQYGTASGYPPPYTCLKDFTESTPNKVAESGLCGAYSGGVKSSAQIIYDVSQACRINPQVLLVLLQKEQSLITDSWPWSIQYRSATGFGCPDTAPCDSEYYGFFNQVYNAARIYLRYARDASQYNYQVARNNNILYNPNVSCGSSSVYLRSQATAGLYNYTPYQPNAAALNNLYGTGDSCSAYGNRNFWRMFNDWFGNTNLPGIIKSQHDNAIYLQSNGYKFYIPSMAVLNDYGMVAGAQTLDDATFNSIPYASPAVGYSSNIGSVVKSSSDSDDDGGAIYLISAGKRYLFTTVQQMADFGFDAGSITYLPLALINSIPSGDTLSNYVQVPGSSFFQITGNTKRLIADSPTYARLNGSGTLSQLSYNLASAIPSGDPVTDNPIMLSTSLGTIYYYDNGHYYYIPTADVLNCWNFPALSLWPYRLPSDSFISPVNAPDRLTCRGSDTAGTQFILDQGKRILIPSDYGLTAPAINADYSPLIDRMPYRSSQLGLAVKGRNTPVVWYMEGGSKRPISSTNDFAPLNINTNSIDVINDDALEHIPTYGIKIGIGTAVKAAGGAAIYVITSNSEKTQIATPSDFLSYGYTWGEVRSVPRQGLDQSYPTSARMLSKYLYTVGGGIYLMDQNACYGLTTEQASAYGQPLDAASAGQTFTSQVFTSLNLARCKYGSIYVKSTDNPTVYMITDGTKRPVSTWSKLQSVSGQQNPPIVFLGNETLASLETGAVL